MKWTLHLSAASPASSRRRSLEERLSGSWPNDRLAKAAALPAMPGKGTGRRSGAAKRRGPMISGQASRIRGCAERHHTACHPTNCLHHRHGPSKHRNFRGKAGIKPLLVANHHRRTISPYSGSIGQGVTATLQSKFERRKGKYIATRPCFTRSRRRRSTGLNASRLSLGVAMLRFGSEDAALVARCKYFPGTI